MRFPALLLAGTGEKGKNYERTSPRGQGEGPEATADPRRPADPEATVGPEATMGPEATLGPEATVGPETTGPRDDDGPEATIGPETHDGPGGRGRLSRLSLGRYASACGCGAARIRAHALIG